MKRRIRINRVQSGNEDKAIQASYQEGYKAAQREAMISAPFLPRRISLGADFEAEFSVERDISSRAYRLRGLVKIPYVKIAGSESYIYQQSVDERLLEDRASILLSGEDSRIYLFIEYFALLIRQMQAVCPTYILASCFVDFMGDIGSVAPQELGMHSSNFDKERVLRSLYEKLGLDFDMYAQLFME